VRFIPEISSISVKTRACVGQASTQAGKSLPWQRSHFIPASVCLLITPRLQDIELVQHPKTRINRYKGKKRGQTMEQVQQSTQSFGSWLTTLVIGSWERAFVGQTETQGASSQWRQVIGIEISRLGVQSTLMRFFGAGCSPKAEKRFLLFE
jgi:hypothetical protein